MKNVKTYNQFINENEIRFALGEVRGSEIRVNAVANKLYLVNFDKNIEPGERKNFIQHIKEKYGTIITQITTHLNDLVITLSIYVSMTMAQNVKEILNDIFTSRAETNMEKSDKDDTEKEENKLESS